MTVEELYAEIGGDYQEAKGRLANDALIKRFVLKFADDTSCADTVSAWRAGDETKTFEASHMAKGVCANLAITSIAELASGITEALRPGNEALRAETDIDSLVDQLEVAHQKAIKAIGEFSAS